MSLNLPEEERELLRTVARFVDSAVVPVASELEHANTYPDELIEQMKKLGLFGLLVPEPYGDGRVSTVCFALVTEELARGWMSLAGALGSHSVVCRQLLDFGTQAQCERYLPRLATGELRAAMALTEPAGGSDLKAITTTARRDGDGWVVNGTKTWITGARRAGLIGLLCKTDPAADPPHRGISILLAEPGPGLEVSKDLPKLGYKGIESCELSFDDYRAPLEAILGETPGVGFRQMMSGLEIGRIQVAARSVGVARAAFEAARVYANERRAFGQPIWRHEAVGNMLADMGTRLHASRLLVLDAAERLDEGRRCDLEAGMAKLFASESCMQIALDAMRIHGSYGYSTELPVERYFRDAPLMIIGEGTNEIQRNVIARRLAEAEHEPLAPRYAYPPS
ncbi:MAG: Butyryl-CoA dehydrogenase [Acidimicrobiaceae bacterium]|nr:Butyryl-CoA dehydrogenase [Acidimicrobiaceae bacterium]